MGYDENGRVMIASKYEIEQAKERIAVKRSIRRKIGLTLSRALNINNLNLNALNQLVKTLT